MSDLVNDFRSFALDVAIHEGSIGDGQARWLARAARPVICEVGLGLGYSAFAFLEENPNVHLISFDNLAHDGTREIARRLTDRFGDRFELIEGDSRVTLPAFTVPSTCYLAHVDGGHDYETARSDIWNLAAVGRVLILDDVLPRHDWAEGVVVALNEAIDTGLVARPSYHDDGPDHRWAVTHYLKDRP